MMISVKNTKELLPAAGKILDYAGKRKIFAFYGTLGAGKTTLIKAICELLGTSDIVSSPTFTIVNEYRRLNGEPLYHIDFYRITKYEEVFDFGIEEYLSAGVYCLMEWPEIIENMLPENTLRIRIDVAENEERLFDIV